MSRNFKKARMHNGKTQLFVDVLVFKIKLSHLENKLIFVCIYYSDLWLAPIKQIISFDFRKQKIVHNIIYLPFNFH